MDSEAYARIKDTFAQVREMPPERRAEYLDEVCGGDAEMRAEVDALLDADVAEGDDTVARALATRAEGTAFGPGEVPGTMLGRYRILEVIGEGGMGTVWRAEQAQPVQREVALKIIKLGMDTREVVIRFEAERQALALMDHPHIAKVFDGGATESGRPYFVMELVEGEPITKFCDRGEISLHARLELFAKVCDAVQHAHQKGVIHRDIKPSNVLVSTQEGEPWPRVIDFGIAKATSAELTKETLFTRDAQLIGTPEYMAPEQAGVGRIDVDTRADVYSLGVVLYELLTGTTPFDLRASLESGYDGLLRTLREVEPDKPSTRVSTLGQEAIRAASARMLETGELSKRLSGELDWIVMKALEKDRERRYETAGSFAADVLRYLANEPVEAAPPSAGYRVRKFVRRNRLAVGSAAAVGVTLVLSTVGLGVLYARSVESERRATREALTSREALGFMTGMFEVSDPSQARGETVTAREILDRGAARIERELGAQPEIRATLTASMGSVYRGLGLYTRAEGLIREALESRTLAYGEEDPEALRLSGELAEVLRSQSRIEEAGALLSETVERQERILGRDHVDTLNSLVVLSGILEDRSELEAAEQLAAEAQDSARRTLAPDHGLVLASGHQLGMILRSAGRLEDAERELSAVLEVRRRILGGDHPETLLTMGDVGWLYTDMGRFDEAEALFLEAQETIRRVLGDEHLSFLKYRMDLGMLYGQQARWTEAEALYREVIETQRRVLGADHVHTLLSINSLGVVLSNQGRFEESEAAYVEAYEGMLDKLGEENEHTLTVSGNLAILYLQTGRIEDAEVLARATYEGSLELHGADHPDTLLRLDNLGNVIYKLGDIGAAATILDEVLDGRRRALGNEHPAVTRTLVSISVVRGKMGDSEAATVAREELLERTRAGVGFDYASVAEEIEKLAIKMRKSGDIGRQARIVEDLIRIRLARLGADHPSTLVSMRDRLQLAIQLEQREQLNSIGAECVEAHVSALGNDHGDTRLCIEWLVEAFEQWGDREQTEAWRSLLPAGL